MYQSYRVRTSLRLRSATLIGSTTGLKSKSNNNRDQRTRRLMERLGSLCYFLPLAHIIRLKHTQTKIELHNIFRNCHLYLQTHHGLFIISSWREKDATKITI